MPIICVFTSTPMSPHVRWPDFFCFLFYIFEVACCSMSMYMWQTNNVCTHVHLCLCYCNICASVHLCAFLYACLTVVMCAHVCAYASVITSVSMCVMYVPIMCCAYVCLLCFCAHVYCVTVLHVPLSCVLMCVPVQALIHLSRKERCLS